MLSLTLVALGLLMPAPATAQEPEQKASAQQERGLVFSMAPGVTVPVGDVPPGIEGRIAVGYKLGRVVMNTGVDLSYVWGSLDGYVPAFHPVESYRFHEEWDSISWAMFAQLQVALAQLVARRLDIIGDLRLGVGEVRETHITSSDTNSRPRPVVAARAAARAGIGLRFWMFPQLALDAITGLAGSADFDVPTSYGQEKKLSSSAPISFMASIGLMTVQ